MEDQETPWTRHVDVIVVGGGGAGMAAALAAQEREPDSSVLLLQKTGELGGTTAMSIGSYSVAETSLQEEHGIDDSVEAHFADIGKFVRQTVESPRYIALDRKGALETKDDLALRRLMVESGPDTFEWLREQGLEYSGPHPEPPHRVPRMHNVQPNTGAYGEVLAQSVRDAGVEVRDETEATGLLRSEGTVTGVRTADGDTLGASRGVVLATGGYVANRDLRDEFTTDHRAPPINEHGTGAGHEMARDVGAALDNMDLQWLSFRVGEPLWTEPAVPALADAGAILVTEEGSRYVNERSDYDQLFESTLDFADGTGFLLFDDDIAREFAEWPNYVSTFPGKAYGYVSDYAKYDVLTTADDLSDLAGVLEMNTEVLESTVEEYNAAADGERVDRYGRTEFGRPLETPPYYALGPVRPYSLITDGGIRVNTRLEVLDEDGSPIDGLYAVGDTAAGPLRMGHGHHHLWLFTSGRTAGREVVGHGSRD